ncbi:MAG: hypothetical protein ABI080_10825, partial [Candidatus Binatia bacterium]
MFFALVLTLAAVHWGLPPWRTCLETLGDWYVKAGPIVAVNAAGDQVLATIVTRTRINFARPTRRSYADDQIVELQLNHPDASDAGRISVARSEASGVLNLKVLGAAADRVWIYVEGLHAVRLSSMSLDVDPTTIETEVPALHGLLSDDIRHYELQADGTIRLLARDGRRFVLDAAAWTLTPAAEKTPVPSARDMGEWQRLMSEYERDMAEATGPREANQPGEFGLDSWRNDAQWLGLLSDADAKEMSRRWARPRHPLSGSSERRRFWIATATTPAGESPEGFTLVDLRAVGPREYLRGGILRDGFRLRAVTIPASADVVVEHYTTIDATAVTLLTRVTPGGDERWTATLPLHLPRTVAAIGDHVALTGFAPGVSDDRRLQLVSVRLSDGAVTGF